MILFRRVLDIDSLTVGVRLSHVQLIRHVCTCLHTLFQHCCEICRVWWWIQPISRRWCCHRGVKTTRSIASWFGNFSTPSQGDHHDPISTPCMSRAHRTFSESHHTLHLFRSLLLTLLICVLHMFTSVTLSLLSLQSLSTSLHLYSFSYLPEKMVPLENICIYYCSPSHIFKRFHPGSKCWTNTRTVRSTTINF